MFFRACLLFSTVVSLGKKELVTPDHLGGMCCPRNRCPVYDQAQTIVSPPSVWFCSLACNMYSFRKRLWKRFPLWAQHKMQYFLRTCHHRSNGTLTHICLVSSVRYICILPGYCTASSLRSRFGSSGTKEAPRSPQVLQTTRY